MNNALNKTLEDSLRFLEKNYLRSQAEDIKMMQAKYSILEYRIGNKPEGYYRTFIKSLILAQDERWRHA